MTSSINERVDELNRTGFLGSAPEERFDRITRLARGMFHVDFAAINFVGDQTMVTKSAAPFGSGRTVPADDGFCDVTVSDNQVVIVTDAARDPRFADRAAVTEGGYRFYAGVPLSTPGHVPIGTLCLISKEPREFSVHDQELLVSLSKWAERELEHHPAS
jgi:GAF domain-containing protein